MGGGRREDLPGGGEPSEADEPGKDDLRLVLKAHQGQPRGLRGDVSSGFGRG
jgi:hypothetical protein